MAGFCTDRNGAFPQWKTEMKTKEGELYGISTMY